MNLASSQVSVKKKVKVKNKKIFVYELEPEQLASKGFPRFLREFVKNKGYKNLESIDKFEVIKLMPEAMFAFLAINLKRGDEFDIELEEKGSGLIIPCKKLGRYEVTYDTSLLPAHLAAIFDKEATLYLKEGEMFLHPLAKKNAFALGYVKSREESVGYTLATIVIDMVRNPEVMLDNGKLGREFLLKVLEVSGVDLIPLDVLRAIKAGDMKMIMNICELIQEYRHEVTDLLIDEEPFASMFK